MPMYFTVLRRLCVGPDLLVIDLFNYWGRVVNITLCAVFLSTHVPVEVQIWTKSSPRQGYAPTYESYTKLIKKRPYLYHTE